MSATSAGDRPPISTVTGSKHSQILGIGAYRPARVVPNSEIVGRIDSTDEWVRERTGIASRYRAEPDETVADMAEAASRQALDAAGLTPGDVDAVLLATVTHPYQTPSAATMMAHQLGATPAMAIDISAACAGFCHGVTLADDMVRGGSARNVLVIGVEKLSDFTNPDDRGSAFIFGDGAGAVVIGPSDVPAIGPTVWGSDGEQWDLIRQRESWVSARDNETGWPWITMAGPAVFRWAVYQMAPVAQKALDAAGIRADQLDAFIPHQANLRIIEALAKALRLPASVAIARDIVDAGNTSAASVPLALERVVREGQAPRGGLALLIGFGAGLSYAAQVVRLP